MDLASVIQTLDRMFPAELAEGWDNTGLLIEPSRNTSVSTILLTNDLTDSVLEEAVDNNTNLIISYHPPIFAPIKALRNANWKDRIVIKCLEKSIAVYSPHTSCDAVQNGVTDWLIRIFDLASTDPIQISFVKEPKFSHLLEFTVPKNSISNDAEIGLTLADPDCEIFSKTCNADDSITVKVKTSKTYLHHILKIIENKMGNVFIKTLDLKPVPNCGMGRIGKLVNPMTLEKCIKLVKERLQLDHIRFSPGVSHTLETLVSTVAVCPGSGSSVLKGVSADLYITGEMSHHDLLDISHRNVSVILCEHSNSERGYLRENLARSLREKLQGIEIITSSSDRDPIRII